MTTTISTSPRNTTLAVARTAAGFVGALQLAGAVFFLGIARHEAVWVGPWVDVPVVALTLSGILLKLGFAMLPGLAPSRRITLGCFAGAVGIAVALVKIPVYDEPEGVVFVLFDVVLLGLLAFAWRAERP